MHWGPASEQRQAETPPRRRLRRPGCPTVPRTLAALAGAFAIFAFFPQPGVAAVGEDDYPYRGSVGRVDPWGFYTGYCTSFVAWRLSQAGLPLRGAVLSGPNGQARFFGNAGDWDRAAGQIGFVVDATPSPGSVAVWHGGEGGAWPTGHAAYVVAVAAAGQAIVEEYNWSFRFRYGSRTVRAPRYIHFRPAPPPPPVLTPPPPPPPSPAPWPAREYRVTTYLRARTGPGTSFGIVRVIPAGGAIWVACQARSASLVSGSGIWDRLTDGTWVTDYYTTTPAYNDFSPGLARC